MSTSKPTSTTQNAADTPATPGPPDTNRRARAPRAVALLGAAWTVSFLAYAVDLAIVLPPLILLGVAVLLRGGRTLLDRLMLAFALLLGVTCAAGLVLSVWPWRLHPVPTSGVALSALVLLAWWTGRRATLPRPALGDLLSVGAAAGLAALAAWPLVRSGEVHRLGIALYTEDVARHANIFSAIGRTGGFLFTRWDTAIEHTYSGLILYPQGWHFTAALLSNFTRSSVEAPSGMAMLDQYMGFMVFALFLFALTMVWTAQWLAAASLTLGRRLALIGVVIALVGATDVFGPFVLGHHGEIVGRTPFVLLLALLARPVARTRQQLVLVGSLLVGTGFTYSLFLPAAGLATLLWLVINRRRVAHHKPTLLIVGLATALLAPLPLVLGVVISDQTAALKALGGVPVSQDLLLALGLLVAAGLLAGRVWRTPTWRGYLLVVGAVGVLAVGLVIGTRTVGGVSGEAEGYYAYKALHLITVVFVVGVGVLLRHLPRPGHSRVPLRRRLTGAVPGALVALAVLAAFGMVRGDSPFRPVAGTIYVRAWAQGKRAHDGLANNVLRVLYADPAQRGVPTLFVGPETFGAYVQTLYLSTLDDTAGPVARGLYWVEFDMRSHVNAFVKNNQGTLRLVLLSPGQQPLIDEVVAKYPDRNIIIVRRDW